MDINNQIWWKWLIVIGGIITTTGGLFTLFANITQQPYIALLIAVIGGLILSAFIVIVKRYYMATGLGWLLTIVIGLAIFILIPRTGMITVVVLDRGNNPLERENVYLLDVNGVIRLINNGPDGQYEFRDVPIGHFEVTVGEPPSARSGGKVDRRLFSQGNVLVLHLDAPTPTPSPTPTPTLTFTPTPTPTPSPTPTPTPLVVADFNSCTNINNLGGEMGAAHADPNKEELVVEYEKYSDRDCVVRLGYTLDSWAGFFLKTRNADLTEYNNLVFDIRSLTGEGFPEEIKIDLIRPGQCSVARFSGIEMTWQTKVIPFENFRPDVCIYDQSITTWDQIEELIFIVEKDRVGDNFKFKIELNNIRFEH